MCLCRRSHLSITRKKKVLYGCQLREPKKNKRIEARHGGKLFNTATNEVRDEKKLNVSLYLDELLD